MDILYKVQTNKSFENAVEDLKKNLSDHNFGVLWELNFKDKLQEKGLDFDANFKVLEVCNPRQAKRVLEMHIEAGYFLPCKIVVYEEKGSVMIGMPKPTGLISMIDNNQLSVIAREVENELLSAIDSTK